MKTGLYFLIVFFLLFLMGCGRPSQDEMSLQPYTNIPTGSVVIVGMKIETNFGRDVIITNEYVLEKFEDGSVTLRGTNGLSLAYAGSMIKFIKTKKSAGSP
jgi:hypothetical protein